MLSGEIKNLYKNWFIIREKLHQGGTKFSIKVEDVTNLEDGKWRLKKEKFKVFIIISSIGWRRMDWARHC